MKQVKIAYAKCKEKMPKRPPDEIDFGLGFRAGLRWFLENLDGKTDMLTLGLKIRGELGYETKKT